MDVLRTKVATCTPPRAHTHTHAQEKRIDTKTEPSEEKAALYESFTGTEFIR